MRRAGDLGFAFVAGLAVALALWQLTGATAGLTITRTQVGATPVTMFRNERAGPGPVVVIAHGFAGSQQLMQPFAVTLARNGYLAVTFDFAGHGRNPQPLRGSLTESEGATATLVEELGAVADFARGLPSGDGRLALLGHSMASDIAVRVAQARGDVEATVAVSMFSPGLTPTSPRNLLVIVGALEPAVLKEEGLRAAGMASAGPPEERVTYGRFADGTARRVAFSPGVEHVGVLYGRASQEEALGWLDAAFRRRGSGFVDARGPWLGLLFLGLVLLARPLSGLLPEAAPRPLGAGLSWRALLPIAVAPALLTPLLLMKLPTGFLPILLGDYLAVHFAVYGLLTAAGLYCVTRKAGHIPAPPPAFGRLAAGASAVALYSILVVGTAIDLHVASFMPIPVRLPLIGAMFLGTLPYFVADEWLTRGPSARRGAYALTKLCFLASLALAVALDPGRLFFLLIIAPVILVLFVVYGLFSAWAYRATRHPFVGAFANALVFAWALAVTFPLLG